MLKYNLRINKARQREIKHIFLEILAFYIGEGLLSYTFDYRIARKLYDDSICFGWNGWRWMLCMYHIINYYCIIAIPKTLY